MSDSGSAILLDCNDNSSSHRLKRMSKGSSSLGHKSSSHEAAAMDVCYRLLGMAIMRLVPMNFWVEMCKCFATKPEVGCAHAEARESPHV